MCVHLIVWCMWEWVCVSVWVWVCVGVRERHTHMWVVGRFISNLNDVQTQNTDVDFQVYCVADLQQKAPPYSEFDFVGMVVSIKTVLWVHLQKFYSCNFRTIISLRRPPWFFPLIAKVNSCSTHVFKVQSWHHEQWPKQNNNKTTTKKKKKKRKIKHN